VEHGGGELRGGQGAVRLDALPMRLALRSTEQWIYGIGTAMISGAATAMDSGLGLVVMDPKDFNLGAQLEMTLKMLAVIGLISGGRKVLAFLKEKPLPVWDGIDTRSQPEPSVRQEKKTETVTESTTVKNPQLLDVPPEEKR
jgi:hypothetical protein